MGLGVGAYGGDHGGEDFFVEDGELEGIEVDKSVGGGGLGRGGDGVEDVLGDVRADTGGADRADYDAYFGGGFVCHGVDEVRSGRR